MTTATLPKTCNERDPMLRWFGYSHLPEHLSAVSAPFAELAYIINNTLPPSAERTVAFRKLLESKDAAVRSAVADYDRKIC